jgi:hypothetical protein
MPLHPRSRGDIAATGARAPAMLAAPRRTMAGRAGTPPRPSRTPHAAGRSRHPRPSLSAALSRHAAFMALPLPATLRGGAGRRVAYTPSRALGVRAWARLFPRGAHGSAVQARRSTRVHRRKENTCNCSAHWR